MTSREATWTMALKRTLKVRLKAVSFHLTMTGPFYDVGDIVAASDQSGQWHSASVVDVSSGYVRVEYDDKLKKEDEWISTLSKRLKKVSGNKSDEKKSMISSFRDFFVLLVVLLRKFLSVVIGVILVILLFLILAPLLIFGWFLRPVWLSIPPYGRFCLLLALVYYVVY